MDWPHHCTGISKNCGHVTVAESNRQRLVRDKLSDDPETAIILKSDVSLAFE